MHYDDWDAFQRDYGTELDRIGYPGGDYLGVKVGGNPASFEQRALPTGALTKPHFDYSAAAALPAAWKAEVSEIAPGFRQPGGGLQVRFFDAYGDSVPVAELLKKKVLSSS